MEIKKIRIESAEGINLICGHAHFIKTAEDLYEALFGTDCIRNCILRSFERLPRAFRR
jgi:adenosine/AMP kinase